MNLQKKFLLICTYEDRPFLEYFKAMLGGHKIFVEMNCPGTAAELVLKATRAKMDAIICCNEFFLNKIVNTGERAKISDFAGSIIDLRFPTLPMIECLIVNPLPQLYSIRYGQFLMRRFISKLTAPEKWNDPLTEFTWHLADPDNLDKFLKICDQAIFISADIETTKPRTAISCVGYCAVLPNFTHYCIVIPFDSAFNLAYIRKINAHLVPKIFQNGLYDNSYFLRFGAPVTNWFGDTFHLFHSHYSELPRDLGFISSFTLRKWPFWKDMALSGDLQTYYEYNARDAFGTAAAWIKLVNSVPGWAVDNYTVHEFPMVFPCLYCQMEGWKVNPTEFRRIKDVETARIALEDKSLEIMTATPFFNSNSHVQVKQLMKLLGLQCGSTKESELKKLKFADPLAGRFIDKILNRREARKAIGTYLNPEKMWRGKDGKDEKSTQWRFLYGINPGRTDTGRAASAEHPFWCGANIQNQPPYIKSMLEADDGYVLAEPDFSQSEARCVAYLSQDTNLIATVESGKDYHAINVERFFGLSYESIFDDASGKVIDKDVRDLSKRVNHGSNYNMSWPVLVDTMGVENVLRAKKLLNLSEKFRLKDVAVYLLRSYENAYPRVKKDWYAEVVDAVENTKLLVSVLGWTRYCFGRPTKVKHDLNAYVAHVPQNLSVQIINKGFYKGLEFQRRNWPNFRLKAQIHDSVPFQFKEGREDLAGDFAQLLDCPVVIHGRTMRIPVDIKINGKTWGKAVR